MERQTEKIKSFSKVICVLLSITYIALIVVGVMVFSAWLWSTAAKLPTEIIVINGVEIASPVLFTIGETKISLPIAWKSGFEFTSFPEIQGYISIVGFGDFLGILFTLIAIRFTQKVFKSLRENGSPFREDVVKALKKLAVVLLVLGGVSGVVPFLAAGIVGVFCLIFDYGRMLQNESDTTL